MIEGWQPWPIRDEFGLARYVTTVQHLLPGLDRLRIAARPEGPIAVARAVYELLASQNIYYDVEEYHPSVALQRIRPPSAILSQPGRGTCLDLTLLYAGLLLDYQLLPVVVVLNGHALALVSRDPGGDNWDSYRPGFDEFQSGVVVDPKVVRELLESGAFVAVECTGFAKVGADPDGSLGGPQRVDGLLSFDHAIEAGARAVTERRWEYRFAFDVAIMHNLLRSGQYQLPSAPPPRAELEVARYVIPHDQAIRELRTRPRYSLGMSVDFVGPGAQHRADPDNILRRMDEDIGVLLTGPAGAGKTRTCMEVATRARRKGWRVLHVSQDSRIATEHLTAAVLAAPAQRTLLVIDYLEVCRDLDVPDLVSAVGPHLTAQGGRLAILATSRPSRLRGVRATTRATEVLDEVELRHDADHERFIAQHMFESVARTALRKLGDTRMAEICGHLPVIALLVAADVERRVRAGQDPRLGTGPNVLIRWLRERLEQDGLIPVPGDASPFEEDEPQPVLLACALAAAACPLDRTKIEELIEPLLRIASQPVRASAVVDVLLTMGWLETVGRQLEVAHDIVTDQFLLNAFMPAYALRVRDTELTALLDQVTTEPVALGHVAGNLARVYADLTRARHADQLTAACASWVTSNATTLGSTLAASAVGGPALYTLLHAQPWQGAVSSAWDTMVEPWLRTEVPDADQVRFFRFALKQLPWGSAESLITAAMVWLAGNRDDAEPVLSTLLRRDDLDHGQRLTAARHALDWLKSVPVIEDASFVLRGLLTFPTTVDEVDRELVSAAFDWLDANPLAPAADFVIRPLFTHPLLSPPQSTKIITCALRWLDTYGANLTASFVLSPLLNSRLSPPQSADAVRCALPWLERYHGHLTASHVLRPMFSRLFPEQPEYKRLVQFARVWVDRHGKSADAWQVLPALLTANHLLKDSATQDAAVVRAAEHTAIEWLTADIERLGVGRVFAALISVTQRQDLAELGLTWLVGHSGHSDVPALVAALLPIASWAPADADKITGIAFEWLALHADDATAALLLRPLLKHADHLRAEFLRQLADIIQEWLDEELDCEFLGRPLPDLIQSALPRSDLAPDCVDLICRLGLTWLDRYPQSPSASFVLRSLLIDKASREGHLEQTAERLVGWIVGNPGSKEIIGLLYSLARNTGVAVRYVDECCSVTLDRLEADPRGEHFDTLLPNLLRSVMRREDVAGEHVVRATSLVVTRLADVGDEPFVPNMVGALLTNPRVRADHVDVAIETAFRWLDEHEAGESFDGVLRNLMKALVRDPEERTDQLARATEVAMGRLAVDSAEPVSSYLLLSLFDIPSLDDEHTDLLVATVLRWLGRNVHDRMAHFLISGLLRWLLHRPDIRAKYLAQVVPLALEWLRTNIEHHSAPYIIRFMFPNGDAGQSADQVVAVAFAWLADNLGDASAPSMLSTLLQCTDLAEATVENVAKTTIRWLSEADQADEWVGSLLYSCLRNPHVAADLIGQACVLTFEWLRVNHDHARFPFLLYALTRNVLIGHDHAGRAAGMVIEWLSRQPVENWHVAQLKAMLVNPEIGPEHAGQAAEMVVRWLALNPTGERVPALAAALMRNPHVGAANTDHATSAIHAWIAAYPDAPVVAQLQRLVSRPDDGADLFAVDVFEPEMLTDLDPAEHEPIDPAEENLDDQGE